jgi:hypothetical protein
MPAIARNQENTPSIINWFTTVNGVLTDMYEVGFQIYDITGGLPGTQIFPATLGGWETISGTDGHYSVGHYYAFDTDEDAGWTPSLAVVIGTHRVTWRWKATASSPYQSSSEDFEVLAESAGGTEDWYITVQDVRDAGLSAVDYPETQVVAAIELWQRFLERACRQWFNARTLTFQVDGNDSDTLYLGVPIISIDYLKLNSATDELDTAYYTVYSSNSYPDDRGNPCIKLLSPTESRNIYTGPLSSGKMKFRKGRKNQEIKGTFGYVESDGQTPKLISRALLLLVCEKLVTPIAPDAASGIVVHPSAVSIRSESTDGHSISYGLNLSSYQTRRVGLSGVTQNPEILDIIKLYRAPLGVASPSHWTYD